MKKYIFTARNNIHIINLEETSKQIDAAYAFIRDIVAQGKSVLFVGTKKQAQEAIKEEAERCGMFYVNTRWLGGTLTNFKTIKTRIDRLNKLNQMEKVGEMDLLPKKEVLLLNAERDKLEKNLGGIKEMRDFPGVIFVVDPIKEHICIKEAQILNIPIVAIVDTNGDPSGIDYVIPANDDALRSVKLIISSMADAIIEAKEGISNKPTEAETDDHIDMNAILSETSNLEIPKLIDEEDNKKTKPQKDKTAKNVKEKAEKVEDKPEEKAEKSNKKQKELNKKEEQ
jgi:small subunit ribosomal protein S2